MQKYSKTLNLHIHQSFLNICHRVNILSSSYHQSNYFSYLVKKKKKKHPYHYFLTPTHDTREKKLPGNSSFLPPSTIRTFLSRCAIRLQSNKSINKTPYQHGSFHDSIMHHHLHPNSSHSGRRTEHTPLDRKCQVSTLVTLF